MNHLDRPTIVWFRGHESIYCGEISRIEKIEAEHQLLEQIAKFRTWSNAIRSLGPEIMIPYLSEWLDSHWQDHCDEESLPRSPRPVDWAPDFEIDLSDDIFNDIGRIDNPHALGLPLEFFTVGQGGSDMLTGDYWRWHERDLPQLEIFARANGYEFLPKSS